MLSSRSELQLQISLLACQAVQSDDPVQHLAGNVQFHNITEFRYETETPVNYVLLVSDGRVELATQGKQQTQMKLEPTVYVAFSNDVNEITGFPASSLANFFCGQQPSGFVLAEDACIQSLVAYVLKEIPLQPFINLLGQGYSLVLTGHRFGGMVANALAAQLLLQLRAELSMAQQMGVNVTALSQTLKKLTSYAFGAPLFCGKALQATLRELDLDGQINTVLTTGDASPTFLTLCAELFSPGAAAEPPFRYRPNYELSVHPRRSNSALSDDLDFCRDPVRSASLDLNNEDVSPQQQQRPSVAPCDFSLDAMQVQSQNFCVIQAWASAVSTELAGFAEGLRPAASHAERFASASLPTRAVLLRGTAAAVSMLELPFLEQTRFSPNRPSNPVQQVQQQQHHPSTSSEHRTGSPLPRRTEDPRKALVSHSSIDLHVGSPPSAITKQRHPGSGSLKPGPALTAVLASSPPQASVSLRASSSKQLTSTSSLRGVGSTPSPNSTKLSSSSHPQQPHPSVPASLLSNNGLSSKASSTKILRPANAQSKTQSVSNDGSGQRGVSSGKTAVEVKGTTSWRAALKDLLAAKREIAEPLYVPVGRFWMLSVATDMINPAVVRVACEKGHRGLVELDGSCLCESTSTWLAADNPQLFLRWELELNELQQIVMEAFAWSSFVKSIDHHGAVVGRESLMNPDRGYA